MFLFLSIYSVHLLTFVSSTGCLFLALTVARLFSRKKMEKRKKMRQAEMRHMSALPPGPPGLLPPPQPGPYLRATMGQSRPGPWSLGVEMWRL